MKNIPFFLGLFLWAAPVLAFQSPLQSSIPGLDIPNAHPVGTGGQLYRSMGPDEDSPSFAEKLSTFGATEVLVFKNQISHEVDQEIKELKKKGIRTQVIPFRWKRFGPFVGEKFPPHRPDLESPCRQTVRALRLIKQSLDRGDGKLLFHCTVGEDRTGYLAGLALMLFEGADMRDAFQNELCQKGYARGNPFKPVKVYCVLREELTPIFVKMAYKIEKGFLRKEHLDNPKAEDFICAFDPSDDEEFYYGRDHDPKRYDANTYRCEPTSLPLIEGLDLERAPDVDC